MLPGEEDFGFENIRDVDFKAIIIINSNTIEHYYDHLP